MTGSLTSSPQRAGTSRASPCWALAATAPRRPWPRRVVIARPQAGRSTAHSPGSMRCTRAPRKPPPENFSSWTPSPAANPGERLARPLLQLAVDVDIQLLVVEAEQVLDLRHLGNRRRVTPDNVLVD